MISSHLWEILVVFHQCGTLSAAAEKMYVSQPSLSASMKQLERELGVTLFDRTKNRIQLNEVGLEAVRLAENLLKQEETIIHQLQEMSWRCRTITVAAYVAGLRGDLVQRLSAMYPDRTITAEHVSSEKLPLGLLQGRFDYVISEYPIDEPGVVCIPYKKDSLLIRLHRTDALAGRASLSCEDLMNSKLLVWTMSGFWASYIRSHFGDRLQLVFVNEEREFHELLWAFHMPSFILKTNVSKHEMSSEFLYVPLKGEDTEVTFYLCCMEKNAQVLPKLLDHC